jgi:hypothetical protein
VAVGLQQVLGSQAPAHGWWYGQLTLLRPVAMQERVMPMSPLLHGLFSLNFLLLVVYLLLFLLAKLFNRLCRARLVRSVKLSTKFGTLGSC